MKKQVTILWCVLIAFAIDSCAIKNQEVLTIESTCKLIEDNFNRVSFSENPHDISNVELNHFYSENNEFEILFYYRRDNGSGEYKLNRIYKNTDGQWIKTTIINGEKVFSKTFLVEELEIIGSLHKVEAKSYFKHCDCFGCDYNTFLIKSKKKIFQIYANNDTFSGLNHFEKANLENYIQIYNYFFHK